MRGVVLPCTLTFLLAAALAPALAPASAQQADPAIRLQGVAPQTRDSLNTLLATARRLDDAGRKKEAATAYEKLVELAPHDPAVQELYGWMALELDRHDRALVAFRKASEIAPERGGAWQGAALALSALARHEESIRAWLSAARVAPTDVSIWSQLATEAIAAGHARDAVAFWERAIAIEPGYFDARVAERKRWEKSVRDVGMQAPAPLPEPMPRVVTVRAASGEGEPEATGSGFFVDSTGGLLTNAHVVRACSSVRVRGEGGLSGVASVVAVDTASDLALLRLANSVSPAVTFREGIALRPGDDVLVVGYPLSGILAHGAHVSAGTVNALAGMYDDANLLQMSAPVQPGNSGGPLLDDHGRVAGVVVTKLNARVVAEATGDIPQNVNFAIKEGVVRRFLDAQGVRYARAAQGALLSKADVGERGRASSALVECWR
ncbi:MAG: hypothetical protein JWO05_3408 [Gemmatimonadetes bacterium]|nr:hypothetical protein [Gemmatimonadota bacterium]